MKEPIIVDPYFRDQLAPITTDKRGIVLPRSSLRRLQLTLDVARTETPFKCEGDFLFADTDSTGTVTIKLNNTSEDPWPLKAQGGVVNIPMREVFITHAAQAGKVMNLWYGFRARFLAPAQDIATIGSITSPINLDPEDARYFLFGDDETADGEAFFGGAQSALNAANVSNVQLFNPVASGKIIYVDRLNCNLTAAQNLLLYRHNAALTTLTAQAANKNIGGAAPVGEIRIRNVGAAVGTLVSEVASVTNAIPNIELPFKAPVRLAEGFGIHVSHAGTGVGVFAHFDWREKTT